MQLPSHTGKHFSIWNKESISGNHIRFQHSLIDKQSPCKKYIDAKHIVNSWPGKEKATLMYQLDTSEERNKFACQLNFCFLFKHFTGCQKTNSLKPNEAAQSYIASLPLGSQTIYNKCSSILIINQTNYKFLVYISWSQNEHDKMQGYKREICSKCHWRKVILIFLPLDFNFHSLPFNNFVPFLMPHLIPIGGACRNNFTFDKCPTQSNFVGFCHMKW